MPDPTNHSNTVAITTAAAITLPWWQFINIDALIGAFAGAILFVLVSKDYAIWERFILMVIATAIGYFGHHELIGEARLQSHTIAAFLISSLAVGAVIVVIAFLRGDVKALLQKLSMGAVDAILSRIKGK